MKRFWALILAAALLLNEWCVVNSVPRRNGTSTTASELSGILKKIVSPCTTEQTNCNNPDLDIVFALDSSSSINDTEFKAQKYATNMIAEFIDRHSPIAPDGTRVGALTFATDVVREFELNEHTGLESVQGYIDAIGRRMGGTNTKLALETAQLMFEDMFLEESWKLIWLHTDSMSNLGDPRPRATSIKKQGWIICVVVIGNHENVDGIDDIASPGCVVKFGSFTEYAKVAKKAQGPDQFDEFGYQG
ncbi:uncharacterized protein LOC106180461 [Lingula anatina]|uniref:Uncharacterized protein LOC106180461 n=1 Tax=Lingula anatina TaxID=7574 RepID=A0A1S3KBN3_LINAN|nr:uncharacterized protein LOC106180461 [Lingula anatina]|eukprot:XP_013419902.1 uncharacterized protein LOC106180461 [Lingula anatina]